MKKKEYIFTLVKFINLYDFDLYLLVRTSFDGFNEEYFRSEFKNLNSRELKIEFEHIKRENLINAFAENISNCDPSVDIEYINEVHNISNEKLFHQKKGILEFDIFCVKHNGKILFGYKINEPYFEELIKEGINIKKIRRTKCRFITESNFEKAKYNRINLFK